MWRHLIAARRGQRRAAQPGSRRPPAERRRRWPASSWSRHSGGRGVGEQARRFGDLKISSAAIRAAAHRAAASCSRCLAGARRRRPWSRARSHASQRVRRARRRPAERVPAMVVGIEPTVEVSAGELSNAAAAARRRRAARAGQRVASVDLVGGRGPTLRAVGRRGGGQGDRRRHRALCSMHASSLRIAAPVRGEYSTNSFVPELTRSGEREDRPNATNRLSLGDDALAMRRHRRR